MPVPLAVKSTIAPLTLAPRLIKPLLAVDSSVNVPEAVIEPDVNIAASFIIEKLLPVDVPDPIVRAEPPLFTKLTLPDVLAVKLPIETSNVLMLPEPDDTFKVVPDISPAFCVNVPDPLADRLIVLPTRVLLKVMLPLLAVVVKDSVLFDAKIVCVVKELSVDRDKLLNESPPADKLNAPAPLLTTVALPNVLSVKLEVDVVILPIAPVPLLRLTLVAVKVPPP